MGVCCGRGFSRRPVSDVASSSVNREEIYARLGVPELWRFDGEELQAHRLNEAAAYELVPCSLSFPFLAVSELLQFLRSEERDENALMRSFVEWVRGEGFPRKSV